MFSGITRIVVHLSGAKGKKAEAAARRYLLKSSGGHDDDVIEVSGPAPKRRGNMGSALGSSSVQTPITSYTHQLRHTEAQEEMATISSFMFECGIPFKTPGTQHGMRCGQAVRKAGPGLRPLSSNTYRTTALNKALFLGLEPLVIKLQGWVTLKGTLIDGLF